MFNYRREKYAGSLKLQVVCRSNENNFIYHFTELFITFCYYCTVIYYDAYVESFIKIQIIFINFLNVIINCNFSATRMGSNEN